MEQKIKTPKAEKLGIGTLLEATIELLNTEETLVRDVISVGTSCAVRIPRKHLGKQVKILILKRKLNGEENVS